MNFLRGNFRKIALVLLFVSIPAFVYWNREAAVRSRPVSWYSRIVAGLVGPPVRLIRGIEEGVERTIRRYFFLVQTAKENERLKTRLAEFQAKELYVHSLERENKRIRELLEFQEGHWPESAAAGVLAHPPLGEFRLLLVNRGEEAGVRRGMPVVSPEGLVGRVLEVTPASSKVLLITDPTSAVDARVVRTGARGLVVGVGIATRLERDLFVGGLEFWDRTEEVRDGDSLVTSGLDGVFPAGIPIGIAQKVVRQEDELFLEGKVIPHVDFHKLGEVLILKGP